MNCHLVSTEDQSTDMQSKLDFKNIETNEQTNGQTSSDKNLVNNKTKKGKPPVVYSSFLENVYQAYICCTAYCLSIHYTIYK